MKDTYKSFIIREAELLSQERIEKNVILSHPINLHSSAYKDWIKHCHHDPEKELDQKLSDFIENESINSTSELPQEVREILEVQIRKNFRYSVQDVLSEKWIGLFKSIYQNKNEETILDRTRTKLADQLLAESLIKKNVTPSQLNIQGIIKAIDLVPIIAQGGGDTNQDILNLIIDKYHDKPIVLNSCLLENRCREPVPSPFTDRENEQECKCNCNQECQSPPRCCAKIKPYVADLYIVKSEIDCYEPSEVSHIENIIQSEIRTKKHRYLQREEIESEQSTETTSFNEKTHQSDERFSLEKEIDKSIQQDLGADAGLTVSGKWGKAKFVATSNLSYNQTKKSAQKTAIKESKDVLNKAISRIETKISSKAIHRLLYETEEKNIHTFGGETGALNDISRQFYFVNQVNSGQVFNYGKRMMLDFYVPEPAELYKRLLHEEFKIKEPERPNKLNSNDILKIEDITEDNYLNYVANYNLTNIQHPPEEILITVNVNKTSDEDGSQQDIGNYSFLVPDGYETKTVRIKGWINWKDDRHGSIGIWGNESAIGLQRPDTDNDGDFDDESNTTWGFSEKPFFTQGNVPLSILYTRVEKSHFNLIFKCRAKETVLFDWKQTIYEQIWDKYNKELDNYNKKKSEFEEKKNRLKNQNPFVLLLDIKEQLKQAAISYISCQHFDGMNAMVNKVEPCGFPQMHFQESEREGDFIRFFEQAFEWKFMNFMLYPYFWSRKCTWEEKIGEESDNMLFQRFLKAGSARISISVREGFESHVNYFLKFQEIWGESGEPPIAGSDFVPIWQEIKEDKNNFNTDREGYLVDVTDGASEVKLVENIDYWNSGSPTPPIIPPFVDNDLIDLDIDREIIIDGEVYIITGIKNYSDVDNTLPNLESTWQIELNKPIKLKSGVNSLSRIKWSTGAQCVGAKWLYKVPTNLVWLREEGRCLPNYPIVCNDAN